MFLEPETIHLHPLNFLINSLDSLPSTQLSLIQFHDQKNEFLSEESMKLWKLRRILSIQFPNLTKLCPKNDQQHDSNFNFNLNIALPNQG